MRLDEPTAKLLKIREGARHVLLGTAFCELDPKRGVRERLRDAVVEVAREAVALLLGDLDHAKPLCRELGRQLDVLERHAGGARERDGVAFLLRVERAILVVYRLEHAKAAPVARIDRHDEDRPRAVAGARIHARIEPWIVVRVVDPQEVTVPGDLRREAAAIEREANLPDLGHAFTALAALREDARPDQVLGLVDDVQRRPVRVQHVGRRERDSQQDLVDVGLESEVALELEQRRELLGLAQRCHLISQRLSRPRAFGVWPGPTLMAP